jgi:RNA polymerase sigma-70 factor (ECF subfamily)
MRVDERSLVESRSVLLRDARRIVGYVDAEDVVQDALERAWRTTTAQADADPTPWLNRIARNVAFDVLRKRARTFDLQKRLDSESAEAAALRRERCAVFDVALSELPRVQRRAIVLHDVAGYSSREIAQLDGVAYHTVRTRLLRARRALRHVLLAHARAALAG